VGVTWLADTAAYFGGKALGRRPLAPIVSPNKTIEGGIAALAAGPLGALAMAWLVIPELAALGAASVAMLGLLVAAAAILGDLVESAIKRECGVKDSSGLLPGHGGLLDRMDSLLWAIPVAYLSLRALL
jgi:phosphatidate cytidylyltransferase